MAEMEFRFQTAVIKVPFREAVTDEDDPFPSRWRRNRLGTRYGRGGGLFARGVALGVSFFFCDWSASGASGFCPGSSVAGLFPSL
jgi:hypothetical protein